MQGGFQISTTKKIEVVDITNRVNQVLRSFETPISLANIFVLDTKSGLTVLDKEDPTFSLDLDLLDLSNHLVHEYGWRHDHFHENNHTPIDSYAHLRSALFKPVITLPAVGRQLNLNQYQKLVFIEWFGPRENIEIIITAI